MISSSSEIKQNPGFSFHSPHSTPGQVSSFPGHTPFPTIPPARVFWENGRQRWLQGPRRRGRQFLPKCRNTFWSLRSISSWSWDRSSVYCCCLIFWMMASASCSKDMATGQLPLFSSIRRLLSTHRLSLRPRSPQGHSRPWSPWWRLGECFLTPPFYRKNSARAVIGKLEMSTQ